LQESGDRVRADVEVLVPLMLWNMSVVIPPLRLR